MLTKFDYRQTDHETDYMISDQGQAVDNHVKCGPLTAITGCCATGGGKGAGGVSAPSGTVQGRHLEGRKYGILKSARYWRIGVCIADSDILHPPHALTQ